MPLMKLENEPKNLASGTNHKTHKKQGQNWQVNSKGRDMKQSKNLKSSFGFNRKKEITNFEILNLEFNSHEKSARVFLLCQIWIVNYYVKKTVKNSQL